MSNTVEMEVRHAAENGDLTIFRDKYPVYYLLKKTYCSENIIHLAANYKQLHFIKAALNYFPTTTCESLICDKNDDANTPFHIAAKVGDVSVIQYLYEFFSKQCGGDKVFLLRMVNKDGNTPAHVALCYGHVSAAMYLVDRDAYYVARVLNHSKKTLLHLAMQFHVLGGNVDNYESQRREEQAPSCSETVHQLKEDLWPIVELLLKIESSITCWVDADGSTPLHLATTLEPAYCIRVIKAMLASCPKAAEVHDEESGHTILHLLTNHQVASYEQGLDLLNIQQVYDLRNSKNHQGDTPLHVAAKNCDTIMVQVLLESSLICDQNCHGNTPFHMAAEGGDEGVTDQLYQFFSTQCRDFGGSDRVFPWRMVNLDGNTPAHVALLYGNVSIAMYLVGKDDSLTRVTNHSKETLLHLAIKYHVFGGNVDNYESQIREKRAPSCSKTVHQRKEDLWPIVELLLKIESSVTCWVDADGSTPLHLATTLEPAYCIRVIKAMLASCPKAAEIHDEESGHTILHLLTNHQVASYEQGLDLLNIPEVYDLRNSKNHQGDTPLHVAARNCDTIMVQVLLESSLICDQNCHGNTPLHIAAEIGDEGVTDQLYEFFSTQCRDSSGSDRVLPWRMGNLDGNTPAHVALLYGNVSVAMYLVGKDDSLTRVTNHSKETLIHLAIKYHVFGNYEFQIHETQGPSSGKKAYQPTENLRPIIKQLLKIESSVTCWGNIHGATPLHQATSLERAYCVGVIRDMLASCPKAAEIHDERSGDTVLHLLTNHQVASYEEGLKLLNIPQVYVIRNSKNHQGDTPLHLAAKNRDTIMVRALSRYSPDFGLMNNSGISAGTLVRQLEEMKLTETRVGEIRRLTKEECEASKKGNVAFLNEIMVSVGKNFLVSRTSKGDNIFHILMQCKFSVDTLNGVEEFIGRSIQRLPLLICQQNCNGDTPIHALAKNADSVSVRLLEFSCKYFEKAQEDARDKLSTSPWRVKNDKGDTPLHVAVRNNVFPNHEFSMKLLKLDEEVAAYTNNRLETPLHLLAYPPVIYHGNTTDGIRGLVMCLLNVNGDVAYMQDEDGLTPILTAVRERNLVVIEILHQQFPDCSRITDYKGRTVWHWFVFQRFEGNLLSADDFDKMADICKVLAQQEDTRSLILKGDSDGNTPLHLAIANRRFGFAQFFLDNWLMISDTKRKYKILLSTENKEGVSCYNLIGKADHLPPEFVKPLFDNGNLLFGQRSMYGIPTTKMEAYTNTIGVIAALLATITFTAAFTVPGGLDSTNGTPLLLGKPMFQVFMTANVVAMCSSMMVLFCLLWIMTTGNKKESILLLDVSVFLLQISFQATFVTFMSGLYVTTITTLPALAISTCVACTVLIILMHKRLVFLTVVPFFGKLIILGHLVGRFASYLLSPVRDLVGRFASCLVSPIRSLYRKLILWLLECLDMD